MSTKTKKPKKKFRLLKFLLLIAVIVIGISALTGKDSKSSGGTTSSLTPTNSPSATPSTSPTDSDRLPSVPADLLEHVYLRDRDEGPCSRFVGDITVLVVFVSDPDVQWTEDAIARNTQSLDDTFARIRQDAASFGAQLNLTAEYVTATADIALDPQGWEDWAKSAAATLPFTDPDIPLLVDSYTEHYQADAVPILFCTNQEGRSAAKSTSSSKSETVILYGDPEEAYHELCHLFGACDFYFPTEVEELAEQYLPDSIMNNSETGRMESLTAYLIGWTDELSSEALQFLEETAWLTPEYLHAEGEVESYTGFAENHIFSSGTYTGYLLDGAKHGQGTMYYNDGARYEGEWANNIIHGQGTFYYNGGDVYTGQWKDGFRNGTGKYTFSNGVCYDGNWLDGKFHGYGVYYYSDGTRYEGEWVDDKQCGQGTMYYKDGGRYEGEWDNGTFHGQGTMYYTNGTTQSGQWNNGSFVG